jgi:lysozyme
MGRHINDRGIAVIKQYEGIKLDAYQDVAGIWTIGYGHIRGVMPGMHISQEEAEQALQDDLTGTEAAVDGATSDGETTDNQFSAMVAFAFNVGTANFRQSSLLKEHLAANYQRAADDFLMWNKARINGVLQPVTGLTNRRNAERGLYLTS